MNTFVNTLTQEVSLLPYKLKKHEEYPMYYLVWEDGVVSKDFYNLTWANHHLKFLPERYSDRIRDSRGRYLP